MHHNVNITSNFQLQVDLILKTCSQRGYPMKLLRYQGLLSKYIEFDWNTASARRQRKGPGSVWDRDL